MTADKDWSKSWKSSRKPSKQRKYRENAPLHHRHKFLQAKLSDKWEDRLSMSSLSLREGDKVKVMRGDYEGEEGEVTNIDYNHLRVELEDLKREKVDGSDARVPIAPSNLVITRPNLDDELRAKRVEEIKEIKQKMEEEEKQGQEEEGSEEGSRETEEDSEEEKETEEDSEEEETVGEEGQELKKEIEAQEIVEGTVADAKDKLGNYEQEMADENQEQLLRDLKAIKQAEKDNKSRKTLINYLEDKIDQYSD